MSASEALHRLLEGNKRFAAGAPTRTLSPEKRAQLSAGQSPFAMVLGCADSRVPVETIFDQQPGDIFTVRIAGNFACEPSIASLEYGFSVLKISLLLVLGHTSCGAVGAAYDFQRTQKALPGHMQLLVDTIMPNIGGAEDVGDAVVANVQANVALLKHAQPILAEGVRGNELEIAGAVYDLQSGRVALV